MLETYYKMLNPTETIQKALPAVTEAFVMFYGEENREFIEQKFRDMLVVGYSSPDTVKSILLNMKELKSKELIEKFFHEIGIEPESEEAKKYINNRFLENTYAAPISYYSDALKEETPTYTRKRAVEFLADFYPEVTEENFLELQAKGTFHRMDEILKKYESIMEEYQQFLNTIQDKQAYVEESEYTFKTLENKYYLEFIEAFKDRIPPEEFKKMEESKENVKNGLFSTPYLSTLIGWGLDSKTLIESFDQENENLLESGQEWRIESVKRDRMKYFQELGIDHGQDYEEYKNDPECRKLIPSLEFIQEVKNKRQSLYTKLMNEYYLSTEDYKRNRQRIKDAGCMVEEDYFNANAYANRATFVSDNLVMKDGKCNLFALLCINVGGTSVENLDGNIIHELNHVIELHLKEVKGNHYSLTCGWDVLTGTIKKDLEDVVPLEERQEKRGYELFSEIVNELIAQEITTILFNSGNYIFNLPGTGRIKGRTGYECTRYLVADFLDQYKEDIIASRRKGNIDKIKNSVGEDNFEQLNELFHIHDDNFKGFEIYNMYDDLQEGKNTPKTQVFRSLGEKRNNVLKSMQEYHSQVVSKSIA